MLSNRFTRVRERPRQSARAAFRSARSRHPVVARDNRSPSIRNDVALRWTRGVNDRREAIGPVVLVTVEAADPRGHPAEPSAIALCLISWTHSGPDGGMPPFTACLVR